MKDILLKLYNGQNTFECEYNGQKRKCEILQIDIRGIADGLGRAYVRFDVPVKKLVRKESENQPWGLDSDGSSIMEDVEVDSYEEWININ